MKRLFLLLSSILILFCSCKKEDLDNEIFSIEGIYQGIFERNNEQVNVNLELLNNEFNGSSEKDKFPAICRAPFAIDGNKITFENSCVWTADFDGSLILGGEWEFEVSNQILILTNTIGDRYLLEKK